MKKILYSLMFILLFSSTYSFQLIDKWLDGSVEFTPYQICYDVWMSDAMAESLAVNPRIDFDFGGCISEMQTEVVTNLPDMQNGGLNSVGDCLVRYSSFYIDNDSNAINMDEDNYGTTIIPRLTGNDKTYETFTLTLNDSTKYPWNFAGGGSSGGVDINTVFRHEIGHCMALDHEHNTQLLTLMASGTFQESNNYEILHIDEQEQWGLKAQYDPPLLSIDGNNIIEIGESIQFNIEGPIDIRLNENAGFHGYIQKNSETYTIDPHYIRCSDDYYVNTTYNFTPDELGEYKFKIYTAMDWNPDAYLNWYDEYYDRPYNEVSFMVVPKIIKPLLEDIYFLPPSSQKGAIADTIEVKVQVPEILGSYQAIKLKIDDVYVDQGDIVFEDNLWVYYWDLSDVTSEITGKRFKIEAELFDDPKCKNESGVMIVEALYFEDFEACTGVGWDFYFYENPVLFYNGWFLYTDPLESENTCLASITQGSLNLQYQIWSAPFVMPDSSDYETILDYSVYFDKSDENNHSNLCFWVTDEDHNVLTMIERLYPDDNDWTNYTYDLSEFYGQTIRFRWDNIYYSSEWIYCEDTTFALDSLLVYTTPPDMDLPVIDYITGNNANVDEDMNINLAFNDASGIVSVTADYNIEGESETITLSSSKNSYTYTGLISARDHVCDGDIKFRVEDEVGNTIISDRYSISWTESGTTQNPSTPSNLIITAENDSTVALTWSIVAGASEYNVYASEDPYGTFIIDTLGTFISGTHWQKNIGTNKMFYRITAGNTSKVFVPENNTKPEKVDIEKNLIFIDPRKKRQ
jgi:hypothetical protein